MKVTTVPTGIPHSEGGKKLLDDMIVTGESLQTHDLVDHIMGEIPSLTRQALLDLVAHMLPQAVRYRMAPAHVRKDHSALGKRIAKKGGNGFRFSPKNGWLYDTMVVNGQRKFLKDFTIDDCVAAHDQYLTMSMSYAERAAEWAERGELLRNTGFKTLGAFYELEIK